MRGGKPGGDKPRRRVDQGAARSARHRIERVEQVTHLPEGRRPQREGAATEPDCFCHAVLRKKKCPTTKGTKGSRRDSKASGRLIRLRVPCEIFVSFVAS